MIKNILVLTSGILFGLGLSLSEMINPTVVLNFLDVFGTWDASLMFVMLGALVITTIGFSWLSKREKPLLSEKFHLPKLQDIDRQLLIGAALFGIGWGLAGYCPGPAIAGIVLGQSETLFFVGAMLIGIKCSQIYQLVNKS